jgi:type VI secretion system secreted protein VgrG
MGDNLSQDERVGKLTTPLGDDKLTLSRFDGGESLSELFEFRIEAMSTEANIDFNAALGKSVTVKLKTADDKDRYFNGLLAEARWAGQRDTLYAYQLVIRPWLWLLSLTSDCRIFSQKSPRDIIKQVFTDRGFSDFRDELKSSYPTLEYCVQYRETDFDFVSRLMEKYGIYYFFEYSDGKHTLVLADMKASHKPIADLSSVPYVPVSEGGRRQLQHLEDWSRGRTVESGSFKLNEYDYNKPGANLLADSDKPGGYAHDSMEMYDYPGGYVDRGVGTNLAKVEAEAAQSLDDRRTGTGSALSLFPGGLVTLAQHPIGGENQEYLVVACSHFFHAQRYRSAGGTVDGPSYLGNFEFTPSSRQFRAELDAERPYISGVQSALVVGKQGEEIDVDEQGRICVQFYWDRKKTASRRVRVAQIWAGSHRGALFLPRIGDEVLIQYEEGDPDRPVVVGSVYNGTNKVVADLPSKKTRTGILTKSSKNSSGYNMLLFDDTAGDEHIKLRAQKALMFKSLGDETRDINGSQTETVGGNETINVGGPTGGGNFTLNAFQSITLNVGPSGALAQIVMDATGITLTSMEGVSTVMIQPSGVTIMAPTITLTGDAAVNIAASAVNVGAVLNTPSLVAAAAVVSGIPV